MSCGGGMKLLRGSSHMNNSTVRLVNSISVQRKEKTTAGLIKDLIKDGIITDFLVHSSKSSKISKQFYHYCMNL
jgi:hypothetical protein